MSDAAESGGTRDDERWLDERRATEGERARSPFHDRHLAYGALISSIDVIYGAIYGYAVYELVSRLQPLIAVPGRSTSPAELAMFVFVAYFMITSSSECRVYNATFPYTGRGRFLLDLSIAGGWLLALMTVQVASMAVLLLVLTGVVGLRVVWCVSLEYETREQWDWRYPRLLVVQHVGLAATLVWMYAFGDTGAGPRALTVAEVWRVWLAYTGWALLLLSTRRAFGIAAADAELLPVGLLHRAIVWSAQGVWDGARWASRAVVDFFRAGKVRRPGTGRRARDDEPG